VFRHEIPLFQIKVCGITSVSDAETAGRAGADAIGLNFYRQSPRYVEPDLARKIAEAVPLGVARVGVFVNESIDEINRIADHVGLHWIQLHGDEVPEFLEQLVDRRIIRAFRCRDDGLLPVRDYLQNCANLNSQPEAVLLDAYSDNAYGGTGHCIDWEAVAGRQEFVGEIGTILAGGLNPGNVAAAIRTSRATAVDVASGVESKPGVKSPEMVEQFVTQARAAFGEQ
jgi:phosphoribosylanthranilate isomerase